MDQAQLLQARLQDPRVFADMLDLQAEIDARARRESQLHKWFPDKGEFRRERYPKHISHFSRSFEQQVRLFMAGNQCLTASSRISTPHGTVSIGELFSRGKPFEVWAWNGQRRVSAKAKAPFKKPGLHECYRITLASGKWIEAAGQHLLLTQNGSYAFVSELLQSGVFRPRSTSESSPFESGLDAARCFETAPGSPGRCSEDRRRCDAQLRGAPGSGPALPPSPGGALPHSEPWCNSGDRAGAGSDISPPWLRRLSSPGAFRRLLAPAAAFSIRTACTTFLQSFCSLPPAWPLLAALGPHPQSFSAPALPARESGADDLLSAYSPPLVFGNDYIKDITYAGQKEVFDFEVPIYRNYFAANLVHHNSGKTSAGCYENTCHLTGLYPDWWDGKRFTAPTKGWIVADTAKTIRESLQVIMFGEREEIGTGMIPRSHIIKVTPKHGTPDAIDQAYIRHDTGGISKMTFKSYAEEEDSFRAAVLDFVHLDEGCPIGIFSECVTRVMTRHGIVTITVTPMKSFSELIDNLLEAAINRKEYDHILGG